MCASASAARLQQTPKRRSVKTNRTFSYEQYIRYLKMPATATAAVSTLHISFCIFLPRLPSFFLFKYAQANIHFFFFVGITEIQYGAFTPVCRIARMLPHLCWWKGIQSKWAQTHKHTHAITHNSLMRGMTASLLKCMKQWIVLVLNGLRVHGVHFKITSFCISDLSTIESSTRIASTGIIHHEEIVAFLFLCEIQKFAKPRFTFCSKTPSEPHRRCLFAIK